MNTVALIVALLIVGLILMVLEILVVPGVGFAGLMGLASFIGGCYFSFNYGVTTGLLVTGGVILLLGIMLWYVLREKTWQRLALETNVESSAGQDSNIVAVGDKGISTTRLAPMGHVRFESGKLLEVKSIAGFVDQEVEVEVAAVEDNIILVKPIK